MTNFSSSESTNMTHWIRYRHNGVIGFGTLDGDAITVHDGDMFGTYQVGAIHGRLITAWSAAALLGPSLVNYISTAKIGFSENCQTVLQPYLILTDDLLIIPPTLAVLGTRLSAGEL